MTGTPLYHPPPLAEQLRPGPFGDYVLSPTRLEHNKGPEKIVAALEFSAVRAVVTNAMKQA